MQLRKKALVALLGVPLLLISVLLEQFERELELGGKMVTFE